ncbi:MAG: hypothetical protein WC955_12455 [Elusimicrobiota bacterium]
MLDLREVKTYSLAKRVSKVTADQFVDLAKYKKTGKYDALLPDILVAKKMKLLVDAIITARKKGKPIILMHGAHVIKCGLAPLVIDLMSRGVITALATNGASIIHDFEIAYNGKTSEDVEEQLAAGKFGMAEETGVMLNQWVTRGAAEGNGLGSIIGKNIDNQKLKYRKVSIFANAYRLGVPYTVHVAIGTDIVVQHPGYDGAAWGKSSGEDFKKFVGIVGKIGNGGVVLNFGSAVILPEVFLKALNLTRNLGSKTFNFTAANFDMIDQYRARVNVVSRPAKGKGYMFIGHHEFMLPLLYMMITERV